MTTNEEFIDMNIDIMSIILKLDDIELSVNCIDYEARTKSEVRLQLIKASNLIDKIINHREEV